MLPYLIAGAIGFVVGKLLEEDEAPKYADGGSVLLAPNGKPSNLTPEQYKLVRTPEFKSWFGDWENSPETASKVVDENGEPLVVLHGSKGFYDGSHEEIKEEITQFSSKRLIFTTTNVDVAKYFGVYKHFFINIKNPLILNEYHQWSRLYEHELIEKLGESDFLKFVNEYFREEFTSIDDYWQSEEDYEPILLDIDSFGYFVKDNYSYDGIIAYNIEETTKYIESEDYIAFEPEQIKLADGSNTTFDGNNPNIRFKEGGFIAPNGKPSKLTPEQYNLVRTPEFKSWFGDWENDPANASKVVDENGEPLVCNHSSREKNIDIFYGGRIFRTKKNQVKPIWFTYKEFYEYADDDDVIQYRCFLNIKNLFDYSKQQDEFNVKRYYIEQNGEMLPDYDFNMDWDAQEQFNLPAYIYEMGYDGYKFTDEYSIVVFNSNQIKLADGTNTTFDGSNHDIRYVNGGELQRKYQSLIEGYELALEIETDKEKINMYQNLIEGYKLALELEDEEIEESKQIKEVMNEEVIQDDFKPSYLMTLQEYQEEVTPLIQAYKKFLKKNKDYFIKPDYYSLAHYSLEEALEQIDDEDSAFARTTKYSTYKNKKEKEETIRENYGYKKGDKFNKKYTQAPTPPNLIAENKEYIEKLKKYFSIEDLNHSVEDDETKSNKRAVRRAIDNNTYKDLLTDKKVELSKLQQVAESVGIRLPKSIFDKSTQNQMKYEAELGKLLADIPILSFQKLQELIKQIEVDLIPLEKLVYEQEYARYSKLIEDNIGTTKKVESFKVVLPMWSDVYVVKTEYRKENTTQRNWKGEFYTESVQYIEINSLKSNWQSNLSVWVKEYVDSLKKSIIIAIMRNFQSINMPIQYIQRLSIEVGKKGFEGSYKFVFENGSSFIMNFQGIGAGGYNIQSYHFRYLTNFSDVKLADGSKGGTNYYDITKNFSTKR